MPRSGAISLRELFVVVACAALSAGARSAWADDLPSLEASPAPRPQSIPVDTKPVAVEDDAPAQPQEQVQEDSKPALSDDAALDPATETETPVASEPPDSQRALGVPTTSIAGSLESQRIIPMEKEEPASGMLGSLDPRTNQFTRVIGALTLVIGLILLLRSLVRRMGGPLVDGGRPSGVLLVLARYPVARGQTLVLLKLGRRLLLCHQSKGEMSTLSEIDGEDEVAAMLARIEAGSRGKEAERFEKMLAEFNHEYRRRSIPSRNEAPDLHRAMAGAPVIDLTKKSSGGGAANWLRLKRAAS